MKPNPNPDDELVEFVDRLLDGKTSGYALSADEGQRDLEETIVRLHRAFPIEGLGQQTLKRMQKEIRAAARDTGSFPRPAWQSRTSRQRLVLVLTGLIVLAAVFVVLPFVPAGGGIEGTAGLDSKGIVLLLALGGVIGLLIGLNRRK